MFAGGFIEALRILTIIPVPGKHDSDISRSLPYFPVIGAILGCACAGTAWLVGNWIGWVTGAGILATVVDVVLTGSIHFDGLADVADSFGASTSEERHRIMKDPHVGTYGVVALVLVLFLRVAGFVRLAEAQKWLWYIAPFVISRSVMAFCLRRMRYARESGNVARELVEKASYSHVIYGGIVGGVVCFLTADVRGILLLIAGYGIAFVLSGWTGRRYGGITGDIIGMCGIVTETLILLFLVFLASMEGGF